MIKCANAVTLIRMACLLVLFSESLGAQDSASSPRQPTGGLPPAVKEPTRVLVKAFSTPVHLVVDNVASSGGLAAGVGVDLGLKRPWIAKADGVYSLHDYWSAEGVAGFEGRRAAIEAYGRLRNLPRISLYGPDAIDDDDKLAMYDMREDQVGASASYRLTSWLKLNGRTEQQWIDLKAASGTDALGIEDAFDDDYLMQSPRFGRYEGALEFGIPASVGEGFLQGLKTRASYGRWIDQEFSRFSFSRVELEAQQRFAVFRPKHRLTLHAWVSSSSADSGQVPFYMQSTLGGRGHLRSVREPYIGTDGSQASLRGYDTFRFRGQHLVLLQGEYRVPIWKLFDATLFYDAGKATAERSELDLSDLQHNYGVSLSLMRGLHTAARFDVGFGGEGVQLLLSLSTK